MSPLRPINQTFKSAASQHRRYVWRAITAKLASFFVASIPALLFPVALVTQVEDKQSTLVLTFSLLVSIASLLAQAKLFRFLIDLTLKNNPDESPL